MTTRARLRERSRLRSRRVRAVLAGGLVLGIGAAATLAAWNDSEYTAATITAGTFDIVGSTDGSTFDDHPSTDPATLSFSAAVSAITPGDTVYALFSVKTAEESMAGTVQLVADNGSSLTGLAAALTYGVSTVSGTTCDSTTFSAGTAVVASGSALTVDGTGTQSLSANGGNQVNYCFAVTLPTGAASSLQGTSTTPVWYVSATSS
ncbi:MAG: SipW-dependent-type signal peptide-containing protein [Microbacterium sp.]